MLFLLTGCTPIARLSGGHESPVKAATSNQHVIQPHLFNHQETQAFISATRKADAIADPLQRCLAYPDPPGSHWTPVAVRAYCHYLFQPVSSVIQVTRLIESGHTAQLDRLMAKVLAAQRSDPKSSGKLEHMFVNDFSDVTPELRRALDDWKRQSPHSGFAYAASGFAYENAAYKARGAKYSGDTPAANFAAMNSLLKLADDDLQKVIRLNPEITPVYAAMIEAGGLSLGKPYAEKAAIAGSRVDPINYRVYAKWLWLSEPKWRGSLAEMSSVIARVQPHVSANPMLTVLLSARKVYEADAEDCDCNRIDQLAQYPVVFDQVAQSGELAHAGYAAHESRQPELALVYLSEALRFDPSLRKAREELDADLAETSGAGGTKGEAGPNPVTQTIGPPVVQAHPVDVVLPSLIKLGFIGYPEYARQALITGTVVTLTYVGKDGIPLKSIVERQNFVENGRDKTGKMVPLNAVASIVGKDGTNISLAALFDPLAIKAMMESTFHPGKRAGVPVATIVREPVVFTLGKR